MVKPLKLLAAVGAVVLIKTLRFPASMLRSIDLGRKLHCAPAGSPLQLNDRTPGRPATVRASNSYLANPPTGTVMELGVPPETEREKSTGLLTTTPTDWELTLPAASRASIFSVWWPLGNVVESKVALYG